MDQATAHFLEDARKLANIRAEKKRLEELIPELMVMHKNDQIGIEYASAQMAKQMHRLYEIEYALRIIDGKNV